jgi:predicted nuclease of predicted toxin-antitoxin system
VSIEDHRILADECIHPQVITFLEQHGCDVIDLKNGARTGVADLDVLRLCDSQRRILLTHDADFVSYALVSGAFYGIIYLRPCHPDASVSEESLRSVLPRLDGLNPPFLVVAHRLENRLRLRIRENLTLR